MTHNRLVGLGAALQALHGADGFIRWQEVAHAISPDGLRDLKEHRSSAVRSLCLHAPIYVYVKPGMVVTESSTFIAARLEHADGVLVSIVRELRDAEMKTKEDLQSKLSNLQLDAMLRLVSRPRDRQLVRATLAKIVGPALAASSGDGSTSGARRSTFRRAIERIDESLGSMANIEERVMNEMESERRTALERAASADSLANKYESLNRTKWVDEMTKHAESQRRRAEALSLGSVGGTNVLKIRTKKALFEVCLVAVVPLSVVRYLNRSRV